jgi:SPOR domain/Type IX secretion system membrane protein PorP/SprF
MKIITSLALFLFFTLSVTGQRIVFPGQNQSFRFLEDPSYISSNGFTNMTGLLQVSDSDVAQTSQYIAAQLAFFDNFAFGLEYSRHSFDYFRYSQLLIGGRVRLGLGNDYHFFNLGFSVGPDQSSQSPATTQNEVGTIYRLGGHYTNYNFTMGGFLNTYPTQQIVNNLPVVGTLDGYSVYTSYKISLSKNLRLTPMVRYNSYTDLNFFESVTILNYKGVTEIAFSYKADYSVNAALNTMIFKKIKLGYSYEKSMGMQNFDDAHSIGVSIDLIPKNAEIPEWLANVKRTNAASKKVSSKKEVEKEVEVKEDLPIVAVETLAVNDSINTPKIEEETKVTAAMPMTKDDPEDTVEGQLKPGFYIILGSFIEIDNANKEVARLQRKGFYARIGKKNANDKYNYVYVDRYPDRETASERTKNKQQEKGFEKVWLMEIK